MTSPPADDDELVRFARLVAHGLRNPLAIATGMLDLLARQVGDDLDEDHRQLVERSAEALRRAGDLVLALQRYAGAARAELAPARVDLATALDDAISELDLGAATVVAGEDLGAVTADESALQRMLCELLDNAARCGARQITVSTRTGGDRTTVVIDDDGPGIPVEQRDAALAEGERLGRTGDGFGLGLPLVRRLTERHGGQVRLADAPGGGLRVELLLPTDGEGVTGPAGTAAPR